MRVEKVGLGFIAVIACGVLFAAMVLSAAVTDGVRAADEGQNVPHFASVNEQEHNISQEVAERAFNNKGMLYDESSVVRGTGDVSLKGSFDDRAMSSTSWIKGTGSMNFESLRSMNKDRPMVNFTQKSDLVFEGGQLKGEKTLESPLFYGRIGASVYERFNVSHMDKSETDLVRSINRSDNTLAFKEEQAFDGIWALVTQQGWSFNEKKSEQQYLGSFQTQKNIEFQDLGKK
jgi:hypothetical protein